ncbi:MAG: DUF6524 family protein [Pseudomonadota bacterium]
MRLSGVGILVRILAAVTLVLATFNPTGYSYVGWVKDGFADNMALKVFAGLIIAVIYIIFLRAGLRSIGLLGNALVLAVLGTFVWVLVSYGILDLSVENQNPIIWIALIAIGITLGIGLSWSIIRRFLTGQMDVDDVEAS